MKRFPLFSIVLLVAVMRPVAAGPLRAEVAGPRVLLRQDREQSVYWQNPTRNPWPVVPEAWRGAPLHASLPNGYEVALEEGGEWVVVSHRGKLLGRMDVRAAVEKWLDEPSLWEPGQVERFRYEFPDPRFPSLKVLLQDVVPAGKSALAVASFLEHSRVGLDWYMLRAQFLVRLQLGPRPGLTRLRQLAIGCDWVEEMLPPRLFWSQGRLLLYTNPAPVNRKTESDLSQAPPAEITQIDEDGRSLGSFLQLPASLTPVGYVAPRWLLLQMSAWQSAPALWALDLQTKQRSPLVKNWNDYFSKKTLLVPEQGQDILILGYEPGREQTTAFRVTVPMGAVTPLLPAHGNLGNAAVWRGRAILSDPLHPGDNTLRVYDLRSGKLVQELSVRLK